MSTQFTNRQWRLPNEENKSKQSNYSLSFDDGSSQYISTGFTISSTSSYTLSAWFKTTTTTQDRIILGDFNSSAANASARAILGFNGTRIYLNMGDGTNQNNNYGSGYNASSYFDGNWHLYTLTINGFTQKAYLNGTLVETWTSSVSAGTAGERGYTVGRYGDFASTNYFNGQIDAVAIYNYALSQSQITTLYGSSSTGIGNPMSLSPAPVAYYPLGDQDAFNGADYLVPNSSLKDYVFDFDSSLIEIPQNSAINISGDLTLSIWVYLESASAFNMVMSKTINADYRNYNFTIRPTTRTITFYTNNGTYETTTTSLSVDLNTWTNIVISCESGVTNGTKFYFNNVLDTTTGTHTITGETSDLYFGVTKFTGSFANYFDGKLSNAQIFNTALPATGSNSIETLYNNGSPLTSMSGFTSLQGWWKLDASATYDGTDWTIPDDSSNSNDGTSSGMNQSALQQSDLSFKTSYSPYALSFDGASSQYIDTSFTGLNNTSSVTISAWMNIPVFTNLYALGNLQIDGGTYKGIGFNPATSIALVYVNNNTSGIATFSFNPSNYYSAGNWFNIVFVFDGSESGTDRLKVYIDKNLVTGTWSGTPLNVLETSTSNFLIGNDGQQAAPYFTGQISNVSVWNASLTSTQVTEIYNEGIPQNLNNHSAYSNLVSWWQLGSNSSFNTNWTVLDEKGTNNGTSVNMIESDIVDGVNSYANGLSSGMGGDEVIGDAPYSTANSLSVNMDVEDRVTDTPN